MMGYLRKMDIRISKENIEGLIRQFVKFGFVGGVNTVLSLVIYWVLVGLGIHYFVTNTVGFIITVAISYVLNNIFTFKEVGKKINWSFVTLLKVYASYFLTGMVINTALLWFWNDYIGINKNLSPILNLFVTIPLNFLLNKLWAYRKKDEEQP